MNIKTEDIEIKEWKPELPTVYLNTEDNSSNLEKITAKCEVKQELEVLNIQPNKYSDADPLDIKDSNFETKSVNKNKCEICHKVSSGPQNLKRHIKMVHEGLKNHKCDICGKYFSMRPDLKLSLIHI